MTTTNTKQANQIRGLKNDIAKLNEVVRGFDADITDIHHIIETLDLKPPRKDMIIDFLLMVAAAAIGVILGAWIAL